MYFLVCIASGSLKEMQFSLLLIAISCSSFIIFYHCHVYHVFHYIYYILSIYSAGHMSYNANHVISSVGHVISSVGYVTYSVGPLIYKNICKWISPSNILKMSNFFAIKIWHPKRGIVGCNETLIDISYLACLYAHFVFVYQTLRITFLSFSCTRRQARYIWAAAWQNQQNDVHPAKT